MRGLHRAAGERGGGVRVGEVSRGEGEQAQGAGGGLRQRVVHQPQQPGGDGRGAGVGVQLLGEVGDGGLGACGEPAVSQHQRGGWPWHCSARRSAARGSTVMRTEPVNRDSSSTPDLVSRPPRVQGRTSAMPVSGPEETATARQSGLSGSRASTCSASAASSSSSTARRSARGGAQRLGELVLGGAGGGGLAERVEQVAGGASDGHGGAVGFAEPGAEDPVGVVAGDLADQFLGERRAAGSGPTAMSSTRARGPCGRRGCRVRRARCRRAVPSTPWYGPGIDRPGGRPEGAARRSGPPPDPSRATLPSHRTR